MSTLLEVTFKTYRVYEKSEDLFLAFIYHWYKLPVTEFKCFTELFVLLVRQDNRVRCASKRQTLAITIVTV